jgi:hypothetical protein
LTDDKTPAEQRAELLSDENRAYFRELAANAPPLTEDQRDVIRAAFRTIDAWMASSGCANEHLPKGRQPTKSPRRSPKTRMMVATFDDHRRIARQLRGGPNFGIARPQ